MTFPYCYRDPAGTVHKVRTDNAVACTGSKAPVVSYTVQLLTPDNACEHCEWGDVLNRGARRIVQEVKP